ncbi:hypothetical protein [Serratia sp. (in: enterobacteria)]|uniref:hypothetical protein n=1 Tax=Serratia sp. (in: enterobacteria) TaxID=616 RepID=UPI003989DE2C
MPPGSSELTLEDDGDEIFIDIPTRTQTLHISENILAARRENWQPVVITAHQWFSQKKTDNTLP